jgi:hypothetical protein
MVLAFCPDSTLPEPVHQGHINATTEAITIVTPKAILEKSNMVILRFFCSFFELKLEGKLTLPFHLCNLVWFISITSF